LAAWRENISCKGAKKLFYIVRENRTLFKSK
jgi:hypothetical protein